MKIKHQFVILSAMIIAIPIVCTLYMCLMHYFHSPDRLLLSGTREIKQIELQMEKLTKQERIELKNTMKILPPDVQATLLDEEHYVLYSTIPEIKLGTICSDFDIWRLMNKTSDTYFYQFTAPNINTGRTLLLTRVPREKEHNGKKQNFLLPLVFVLMFFVAICFIIVVFISKNIFRSIETVEEKTGALAEGKLETQITISNQQNEITSTLNNLETMRKSLVEAQNRKNKFIMGISHDLRTPVAVIKGYTEAIQDGLISEPQEIVDTVELIEGKATQLENMINTLISYTKMESSELKEKLQPANITKLITGFAKGAVITGSIYKRNIISDINLTEDYEVPVDEQLFSRLFENLYSNAIRYSNDNDTITISAEKINSNILFKVSDTGIGIKKEDLKNIFDLFYRGTNSRREEGMGIGLSVVKNIVDIHGWTIDVSSEKGQGTCFTVTIPLN